MRLLYFIFSKEYWCMKQLIYLLTTLLLVLDMGFGCIAQSDIVDNYVNEAYEKNLSIRSAQLQRTKQESKVAQAESLWNPSLDLNASYLLAEGGRKINFPVGDLFNPTYATLNQLTGTEQFPTDLDNLETQLTPSNFVDAQVQLSKPLLNSSIKYNLQIQETLTQINDQELALSKNDVRYRVKSAYYNHLKTIEAQKILTQNQTLLNEVLLFNKKLIKYDKATKDILSDVEFQIENINSQKIQLQEQEELSKALFNMLLDKSMESQIEIDSNILEAIDWSLTSHDELKSQALSNRPELKQILIGEEVNELNKERIDHQKLPTLGVSAGIGIQTENFQFDDGGPLYTLGIGMSWNLIDGGLRKRQLEELQIDKEILGNNRSLIERQIEIETLQRLLALKSIQARLRSQEAAVKSASTSYDILYTKYKNDKALLIEVLQAQNQLVTSQLNQTLIKYDYLNEIALLEKTIASDL